MLKIPPVYRQQLVTRYRTEERLTGRTTCVTHDTITNCRQDTRLVSIPYTDVEIVDIRRAERNPQIDSCAARACMARFGNSKCET